MKTLSLLGPFLSMYFTLGILMDFLIPQYTWELLRPLFSCVSPFPSSSMVLSLSVVPCSRLLCLIPLPLNDFSKSCLGNGPRPGNVLSRSKQRETFVQILEGADRQVKTQNHNALRFVLLSLALATCSRVVSCHTHGHFFVVVVV